METKVTVVCDNMISRPGLLGQHGLSMVIEKDGESYLFDTGQRLSLSLNLKALGKNPRGLKKVFISHGHYDHTGGLKWLVRKTGRVEIIAHSSVFSRHMLSDREKPEKLPTVIGVPWGRQDLERLGAEFRLIDRSEEVVPGIMFLTGIEGPAEGKPRDDRLVLQEGDRFIGDPVEDDASLILHTGKGPVLLLGCAHSGVLNILDYVQGKLGVIKLHAVIGGTHLMFYGLQYIPDFIERLDRLSVDLVGVSHCTGLAATIELAKLLGDKVRVASAGSVFIF
jgi:7,8-dihydropterin-6-yl-methyl-4-(beta-D-ribofuranosyl)aminobenzene 5'-phosphate synthase